VLPEKLGRHMLNVGVNVQWAEGLSGTKGAEGGSPLAQAISLLPDHHEVSSSDLLYPYIYDVLTVST
jgi:hypothetical protein